MSIIINELKKITKTKAQADEKVVRPRIQQSALGAIQDKLTDTYLKPKADQTDIKYFIETYRKTERAKFALAVIFFVFFVAFALFIFFSKDRFQINISIEKQDKTARISQVVPPVAEGGFPEIDFTKMIITGSLMTIGDPERDIICLQRVEAAGEAEVSQVFLEDIDLSDAQIKFSLKGLTGGESTRIYFEDAFENRLEARLSTLGSVWRRFSISLNNPGLEFHNDKIREIGFDFGAADLGNPKGMTIFLREMKFVVNKQE